MIQRGGQVVIRMLANVRQATIGPLIERTIAPGSPLVAETIREQEVRTADRIRRFEKKERQATIDRRNALVLAIAESPRRTLWAGIDAYRELPEWAQPVTWGLAAGTPFAIVGAIFLATRH